MRLSFCDERGKRVDAVVVGYVGIVTAKSAHDATDPARFVAAAVAQAWPQFAPGPLKETCPGVRARSARPSLGGDRPARGPEAMSGYNVDDPTRGSTLGHWTEIHDRLGKYDAQRSAELTARIKAERPMFVNRPKCSTKGCPVHVGFFSKGGACSQCLHKARMSGSFCVVCGRGITHVNKSKHCRRCVVKVRKGRG